MVSPSVMRPGSAGTGPHNRPLRPVRIGLYSCALSKAPCLPRWYIECVPASRPYKPSHHRTRDGSSRRAKLVKSPNQLAADVHGRPHGHAPAGPRVRVPRSRPKTRIHRDRRPHPRPGHRREHDHLQPGKRRPACVPFRFPTLTAWSGSGPATPSRPTASLTSSPRRTTSISRRAPERLRPSAPIRKPV